MRLKQRAQAVGFAGDGGLGDAEEELRRPLLEARGLHRAQRRQRLHQRLGRAARLGDDDEAGVGEIEGAERRFQRHGVEVVVEARARAAALLGRRHAGDVPAAELGQRLAAEARAADAEEDDGVGALGEPGERGLGRGEVGGLLGDAQVGQAARLVVVLQRDDSGPERIEPARELGVAEPVLADGAVEAARDRLRVGGGAHARPRSFHSRLRGLARIGVAVIPAAARQRGEPARTPRPGYALARSGRHQLRLPEAAAVGTANPTGLPTMMTMGSWPSNRRLAARLMSSMVTASISPLRRST